MTKKYYSVRIGKETGKFDFESLKEAFLRIYKVFELKGYFNEYLGWECVDLGYVNGLIDDVSGYFLIQLKKKNLWPIQENLEYYSEEDLFDVMKIPDLSSTERTYIKRFEQLGFWRKKFN